MADDDLSGLSDAYDSGAGILGVNMTTETNVSELVEVAPGMVQQWITQGDTVMVDVREDFEHASERIDQARSHSLSGFDPDQLRKEHGDTRVVFHCRSGKRSAEAAALYGGDTAFHLQGGIEGWKAAGLPTVRSAGAPTIDVMRQVQITAGALILTGVVLGSLVHPWLYGISAFVGCGLMFAGFSGWCGMAKLLGMMPWNMVQAS